MAVNEERVNGVTKALVEEAGYNWEGLSAIQQYYLMEETLLWEKRFQAFNAKNNIVEAQVSDSIFGFGPDE